MARPRLTDEEREKRRIRRALTRDFFMEALRREIAQEERAMRTRKAKGLVSSSSQE